MKNENCKKEMLGYLYIHIYIHKYSLIFFFKVVSI